MNFFENAVIFDKFQIIEKLEDGSIFSAYLGKNLDTGAKVYIKMLNPDKYTRYEVDKICYSNELPIIKSFDHKNVLKIIDAGIYSNTMCIISEYVGSTQLDEFLVNRGALEISTSLNLISQLASALHYTHSKNVLHRSLKASTIGLCEENGEFLVKLYDFGISYIIDFSTTRSDQVDSEFGFMAPESTGLLDRKVDMRSDLYSLGILLYRFLTGNYPFHADSIDSMVYQHVAVMPKDPREFNPSVPLAVSKMVMKLLMKDPDQRYQTANELINDIDLFMASNMADLHLCDEDIIQTMDQRSKLLSRKYELALLRNYYTKALEGPGRFCLVRGSLGCGKSDLFGNLCNELENADIPYFRAHFSAQATLTPYFAFQELLKTFAVQFSKYDRRLQITERNRLARSLMGLSDLVFKICPEMKAVLPESLSLPTLEGFREQQRSVMLLSNFFMSLVQNKPFVIIMDDIHFADAASLSLLNEMAAHVKEYKIFVLCSCRETATPDNSYLNSFLELFKKDELFTQIILHPFDERRMCEFLSDMLILDKEECQVLSKYIVDKTGGNPYFAVNVIRTMLEDNAISVSNGFLEQNWEQLRIINHSSDVLQLIERRMSRLSPEAMNTLETASVIGDMFRLDLLMKLTGLSRKEIIPIISSAVSLHFIEYSSSDDLLEFSHRDIHTAFISRIEPERLKELHYRVAKGIEEMSTDIHRDIYSLVYHFTEAGSQEDISKYILEAAALAQYSSATNEALSYYSTALDILNSKGEEGSEDWCIAMSALVDLNLCAGNCDYAIQLANKLLPYRPDALERANLFHRIGAAYYRLSDFTKCEEFCLKALEALNEKFSTARGFLRLRTHKLKTIVKLNRRFSPDPTKNGYNEYSGDLRIPRTISSIYKTLCIIYSFSDLTKFKCAVLRMYTYTLSNLGPTKEFASALSALAVYYMFEGNDAATDQCIILSRKIRKDCNDPYGDAECNMFAGMSYQWRCDLEHSIRAYTDSLTGFKNIGDIWQYNNTSVYLCNAYQIVGDYKKSIELCDECIRTSLKLHDNFSLVMAYTLQLCCYTELGNYANAEEIAKRCKPVVDKLGFPYTTVAFYAEYGRLQIEIGKYSEAVTALSKAKDLLDTHDLSPKYNLKVKSNLSIAMSRQLSKDRTGLTLQEIQSYEYQIANLSDINLRNLKHRPANKIMMCRSTAMFNILTEHYKKAQFAFTLGLDSVQDSQYHYENARLMYDYGEYLISKHKVTESRFYIFEAYMIFSHIGSITHMKSCEQIIADKFRETFQNSPLLSDITARRNRMNVDRKVNTLLRLGERLTSTLEIEELQRKILQDAVELVGAERGILFLYPESGEKKLFVASVYNLGNFDCNTYDWMLEEVEKNRKPIVINDVQSDEYRKHYSVMARYGIKSVMAMPMFVRGVLFGVIYLDSRLVRQIFSDDYIEAMGFIANQAGAPIENARLYHRAITDGLTGIYGRSYLDNLIIDRTSSDDASISAIMIDVDNFKRCNDTYGHPFGDKVLKQIANIMKRIAGDTATSCRYGGEEFVVLVDSNDPEYVTGIAEKIRSTVEKNSITCNNDTEVALVSVTISLGVSVWDSSMERVDLIEHADKALYWAKTHGKNQVVLWNENIK